MEDLFLGRGLAFPVRADASGRVALAEGIDGVERSIRIILGTAPGERPMRPEFGCGLHDLVFAPLDVDLPARVRSEVTAALRRWEPRIDVLDVAVEVDPEAPTVVSVSLTYRVKRTNDPRNLVVPFYVIGSEPS